MQAEITFETTLPEWGKVTVIVNAEFEDRKDGGTAESVKVMTDDEDMDISELDESSAAMVRQEMVGWMADHNGECSEYWDRLDREERDERAYENWKDRQIDNARD